MILTLAFFLLSLLYSAVGHGGASGYLAAMALVGVLPAVMRPTALVLNVAVASIAAVHFARAGHFSLRLLWPFALGSIPLAFGALRLRPLRRLPIAFGWLTTGPIDADAEDSYVLPVLTRSEIRRDVRGLLGGLDPAHTLDAATKLTAWDKPALIAWSAEDRFSFGHPSLDEGAIA